MCATCVCIMWLIPLLFVLVAQARCQLIAVDLFTFVSWQEHEISSVCAAAAPPANSTALQVFPLLPLQAALSSCRPPAEGRILYKQTNTGSQTMVHWSLGKTSTLCINVGWLMLTQTCLQTYFSSTYIKCQWISGSYGLSGVSLISFLEQLDIEESFVLR